MSEQEKQSDGGVDSSVVLLDQSAASRHKQPFRPIDMQEDVPKELQHKRSKAPAVPSVTEELKESVNSESKGKTESERAMSSEKHKHVAKKLSLVTKRRASSPEAITLAPLIVEMKKDSIKPSPIPAQVSPTAADSSLAKHAEMKKDDEDSITEDVPELRTPEVVKVSTDWSDDEGAGGLPRSESRASRASRVSRAVRQLFCCGMPVEPPSEHNMSPRTQNDVV